MKEKWFVIKVADLLNQPWKSDELSFESKSTEQLPNLDENWLSWIVLLQSLDKNSILVDLVDVQGVIEDSCDICQKSYKREFVCPNYRAKFILPEYDKDEESDAFEEIFPIEAKTDLINIEDMLVQAVILQEPIVKRCEECETKKFETENIENDEVDYFEWKSNIIFK